ncbi:MAG: hypothetical protein IKS20_10430 [Victivallales bacterium]|nr:hypothetical protein [Victivallales bacterium]
MKSTPIRILSFAVAFILLVLALSAVQGRMNGIRYDKHLTDADPLENAPPLVAFTSVALGGFRGLAADLLWLRSSRMQDEGKYFEMVQLADWIIKLQPRNTSSHAFLAWNMAYNISVTFTAFEDRWRWVRRGIELIRDEALDLNPGDAELFRQLGWIYQHKMGKDLDDANRYYKTEFAKENIRLFADYYGRWDELINAPTNEEKLRAALGDKYGDYVKILAKHGFATFKDFEQRFRELAVIPVEVEGELKELGVKDTVEICLRNRWMTQKYKLDPAWLKKLNERYGELDWRLPEAHAIYWAERGKEKFSAEKDKFKRLSCDRMIFQSLAAAFGMGRLVYLKKIEHLEMTPNTKIVDAVNKAYQDAMALHGEQTIGGAYGNFLVDAIVTLYKFGEKKKAEEYRKIGSSYKLYGDRFTKYPLEEFVLKELAEDMKAASYAQAQGTVQSYLINSYYQNAIGEDEVAASYAAIAKQLYDRYQKFVSGTEKRRALPPWLQMAKTSLEITKQRIHPELAKVLEARQPRGTEVFIPEAKDIKAPEVK